MIDVDFLSQLRRFSLIVKKRITSSFAGEKKSFYTGQGLVFNDYRQYSPGDDFRTIDWNIYARTDELFIKRFEEDKNLSVHILIDSSKSMDYGRKNTKFEYAAMIALGYVYLSMRDNEKIHLSTFSKDLQTLRSERGSNEVLGFLNHLNRVKCQGVANIDDLLTKYKKNIKSKSMVILISDFLMDSEKIKSVLHKFKNHDLKIIQVLHKNEINLNVRGSVILKDSETDKEVKTYLSERMKNDYRKRMYDHITMLMDECNRVNAKFNLFSTEQPMFEAFYKMVA